MECPVIQALEKEVGEVRSQALPQPAYPCLLEGARERVTTVCVLDLLKAQEPYSLVHQSQSDYHIYSSRISDLHGQLVLSQ